MGEKNFGLNIIFILNLTFKTWVNKSLVTRNGLNIFGFTFSSRNCGLSTREASPNYGVMDVIGVNGAPFPLIEIDFSAFFQDFAQFLKIFETFSLFFQNFRDFFDIFSKFSSHGCYRGLWRAKIKE